METRLTLRPGQDGTKKLVQRFGKRLLAVRYVYDREAGRRYKTVELIVEVRPWTPRNCKQRHTPDDIVQVRIGFHETLLRERARNLGGVWRTAQKVWKLKWDAVRKLGIEDSRSAAAAKTICP